MHLPSFAGHGWPERMRSTVVAFMGLTAAAGLALVAVFAQLGFPLLTPAPMPTDPSLSNAVGEAKVARTGPSVGTAVPAAHVGGVSGRRQAEDGIAAGGSSDGPRGNAGPLADPPTPAVPVSPPSDAGGTPAPPPAASNPAPPPVPSSAPTSTPAPAAPPVPAAPSKPEAAPPQPAPPEPAAAPGNSSSTAAAEHASARGVEASAGPNGKALGHDK